MTPQRLLRRRMVVRALSRRAVGGRAGLKGQQSAGDRTGGRRPELRRRWRCAGILGSLGLGVSGFMRLKGEGE